MSKNRKIVVVGTGLVGSSCAYSIASNGVAEELVLIDINKDRASAEANDIIHGVEYMNNRVKVYSGEYADCGDADIIVIAAGGPPKPGQTRLDTLDIAAGICTSIVPEIMKSGFNGIFLIASNPVDVITYHVWKLSGLPSSRVIGSGTLLDTARLKTLISKEFDNIDCRSIHAYIMGEHGDSQMCPWSNASIGGVPLLNLLKQKPGYDDDLLDEMVNKTAKAGIDILSVKGSTYYGIATCVTEIITAIVNDEKRLMPVSSLLQGEYGETNVYCGVPTVLGCNGVEYVFEIDMTKEEKVKFNSSINILKEYISKLGY